MKKLIETVQFDRYISNNTINPHLLQIAYAITRRFNLKIYVASVIEKRHNRAATRTTQVGVSSTPRPRRMSLIYQRSPLHDSDIIHSAHDT